MEHRRLGRSGFSVPVLSFGAATFTGGTGMAAWGTAGVEEARRMVDICIEAGVNMFDTADVYSRGVSETILGEALTGRPRDSVIISTKGSMRMGDGPNDIGSSRKHLTETINASLKRLKTDYIDLFQLHAFDAFTPVEEALETLDGFVKAGKIRYLGVSNFSGWHLMKALAAADRHGLTRYVANQTYYSLVGRDYEWELMPLSIDQGLGAVVWSPLGWGRLTGKIRRGTGIPEVSRLHKTAAFGPPIPDEHLFNVVDALEVVAQETSKTIPQVALNWLLQRPTVSTVVIGARDEGQLRANLGAVGWNLTAEQVARLDAASAVTLPYPYWHQRVSFAERNPPPV